MKKKQKFQTKLYIHRKKMGLTQADMAELLGINVRAFHYKENGRTEFKGSEMYKLAKYFNTSIEELFIFEFEDENNESKEKLMV